MVRKQHGRGREREYQRHRRKRQFHLISLSLPEATFLLAVFQIRPELLVVFQQERARNSFLAVDEF